MALNLIQNPSFESGSLAPWTPHAANVAQVVASNAEYQAFEGDYYLYLPTLPPFRPQLTPPILKLNLY